MSYNYATERPNLFTEEGVTLMLKMRDQIRRHLDSAGAFKACKVSVSGDGWLQIAALDYMVEKGELVCLSPPSTWAQHRVYADTRSDGR